MPAIPLRGDRSAWDAENYRLLHANDIDLSASSIHHTLGTSPNQAASGDHTHDGGGGGGGVSSDAFNNTWGGTNALESFTAASLVATDNTAFGFESLDYLGWSGDTWIGNTAFGSESGWWFESGNYNTFIGYKAGRNSGQLEDVYNSMGLGANSYTTKNNQIVIGDDNIEETLLKGTVILNEAGSSTWDFRAESDNQEYMIFLDSSANKLYLGGLGNGVAISSSSVDIVTTSLTLNGAPIGESLAPELNDITDVHSISPNDGDVLTWNAASGSWVPSPAVDWRVTLTQEDTANDSDKTFTVPSDIEWQILWIWVEYTSTATPGVRQLEIQLQDASSNIIGQFQTAVTQTEGLTYKYLFAIGVSDLTSVRDGNNVTTPLPAGTFLSAGQKIRVWDNKAIDASADDMTVKMQYATRTTIITEVYYSLSVNSSSQIHTADKVGAFTRQQLLAINNTAHVHTSENTILASRYAVLSVQDSAQVQTSESITLPQQTYAIVINNGVHLQTSQGMALTQYHILAVNNSSQKIVTGNVILSLITHYDAVAQNAVQAQTSDNTSLTFYAGIIVENAVQAQDVENTIIETINVILSIADVVQTQSCENIWMYTNKPTLGMRDSVQVQTSDKITFPNMTTLSVNSSTQGQVTDGGLALTHNQKPLTMNNSSMKLITQNINLVT